MIEAFILLKNSSRSGDFSEVSLNCEGSEAGECPYDDSGREEHR